MARLQGTDYMAAQKQQERVHSVFAPEMQALAGGISHPYAALVCMLGVMLHIVISDPLLNAMGIRYSAMGIREAVNAGKFYEKIHPGTYIIFLSFLMLLWSRGNPLKEIGLLARHHTVSFSLFIFLVLSLGYMVYRSGPSGLAFMIDTHMTVALCVMVLSYAPVSMCRTAIKVFLGLAVLNSAVGIAESLGRFRVFSYNQDWVGLHGEFFRATALKGHPLSNTTFTMIAVFITCGMRIPVWIKSICIVVMTTSLVAFGGRAGLATTLTGLGVLGAMVMLLRFKQGRVSLPQMFLLMASALVLPALAALGVAALIQSDMGVRIASTMAWDNSAQARWTAFQTFELMTTAEVYLGVSTARILDIAHRLSLSVPLSDIENPWMLMFINMGLIIFMIWLALTVGLIVQLLRNGSLSYAMAVVSYFVVASTYNSFGRKDTIYLTMVAALVVAVRAYYVSQAKVLSGRLQHKVPPTAYTYTPSLKAAA